MPATADLLEEHTQLSRLAEEKSKCPFRQEVSYLDLPEKIQEYILLFFSFEEVGWLRLVCQEFSKVCESILTFTFQRMYTRIERRIFDQRSTGSLTYQGCLTCKALYLAEVEWRFIRVTCWRYIQRKNCCFFAGRLLDLFNHILSLSYDESQVTSKDDYENRNRRFKDLISNEILDELSFKVETFIKYFQAKIEPKFKPEVIQIGVKVLDMLDCFLGSSCDLDLIYNNETCILRGRYFCPLSGVLYSSKDTDAAERYVGPECDINLWLADLRELVRKSNQRFIGNMIRDLSNVVPELQRHRYSVSLYAGKRQCNGRMRSKDGTTFRQRFQRDLQTGRGCGIDSWSLKCVIRVKFPLWQWPLELENTRNLQGEADQIYHAGDEITQYFDKMINFGYPCQIPQISEYVAEDDSRRIYWYQSEISYNENPMEDYFSQLPFLTPKLTGSLKLSFQPTRFRQYKWPRIFRDTPTIHIKDAWMAYEVTKDADEIQLIQGRVRKVPGCKVVPSMGLLSSRTTMGD